MRTTKLAEIDALRGIAVLAVFIVHAAFAFPAVGRGAVRLLNTGRYGVDLFFVISGFVLYHAYRRLAATASSPRPAFLFRRWARLAPVYYLGAVIYGFWVPIPGSEGVHGLGDLLLNLAFLNGWIPGLANAVVDGGWSISAEATFAVVFAVLVPWLGSARRAFIAAAAYWVISIVAFPLATEALEALFGPKAVAKNLEYFALLHPPTFLAGVGCWHLWNARQERATALGSASRAILGLTGASLVLFVALGAWRGADRVLFVGAGSALILHAWMSGPLPPGLLSPLAWLGRVSYGAYVIQFGMQEVAQVFVVGLLPAGSPSSLLLVSTLALNLALTLPLAWVSWVFLEKPIQRWAARRTTAAGVD